MSVHHSARASENHEFFRSNIHFGGRRLLFCICGSGNCKRRVGALQKQIGRGGVLDS